MPLPPPHEVKLHQLEYFLAVADAGSLSAAARELFITQPSLSQQIAALERHVGGALFDRLPRGVRLTAAGRAFHRDAEAAVRSARAATRSARNTLEGHTGELHLATVLSVAVGVLPTAIHRWHTDHPAMTLRLLEYHHADAMERDVAAGAADLAVGPWPASAFEVVEQFGSEEFVVVLPVDDPLAAGDVVDLRALSDRDWVLFASDHGLSETVDALCRRAGFTPRGAVRTSQVEAAARLAAAGLGPALVPENVIPSGLDATVRPIRDRPHRPLVTYARGALTPPARALADAIHGYATGVAA